MEKKLYERVMPVVSLVAPFANVPQLLEVWIYKNPQGVSLTSWIMFLTISIIWFGYGLSKNDRNMIVMFGLIAVFQLGIVSGLALYNI